MNKGKKEEKEIFDNKESLEIDKKTKELRERLKILWGELNYDYSKVFFNSYRDIITVICKKHGNFNKCTRNLTKDSACRCCKEEKNWIERVTKKYNGKYDYSMVNYFTPLHI